jgi:glycosyltransferase involved in cell wall biosynthesis
MPPSMPTVTVIVPCRNERGHIGRCLDSILSNDYPKDRLEVLVADGMSEDGTVEIVRGYTYRHPSVRLVPNPARVVPSALNRGIAEARGEIIIRMDAHNLYPPDYLSVLVHWLERTGADNVGAAIVTLPADDSVIAHAIAFAVSHPFGIGNARFRLGVREPLEVDTVPFGCFRRELFDRLGLFDEDLVRNQDDEFNARIRRAGGRILLVPGLVSRYYARGSLRKLARMYFQYGWFKPYVAYKVGRITTGRQLVPPLFVLAFTVAALLASIAPWMGSGLAILTCLYLLGVAGVAAKAVRRVGLAPALALVSVFPTLHFSYGLGYLYGLARLVRGKRVGTGATVSMPLSR